MSTTVKATYSKKQDYKNDSKSLISKKFEYDLKKVFNDGNNNHNHDEKKELNDLSNVLLSMQKDINLFLTDQMKITDDNYEDVEEMEEEEQQEENANY